MIQYFLWRFTDHRKVREKLNEATTGRLIHVANTDARAYPTVRNRTTDVRAHGDRRYRRHDYVIANVRTTVNKALAIKTKNDNC